MIERVILGCHNLTGGSSFQRSKRVVDAAFDLGIRRFDVAPNYGLGTAERTLAQALGQRRRRPDIEITTKFGQLPPRFGYLASLIREPYRFARRLAGRERAQQPQRSIARVRTNTGASDANYPLSPTQAALRSIRNLGIDRLGGFLVHERLSSHWLPHVFGEIEELKRRGLVARNGLAGEIENVRDMLTAIATPDIVQVAMPNIEAAPACGELRIFNLMRAVKTDASRSEAEIAADLARAVRGVFANHARASVLFNTSSPQRLELFVEALGA